MYAALIIALFFVPGAIALMRGVWLLLTAIESRAWPRAQGMIVDVVISEGWFGSRYTHRPRVRYRYEVDGNELYGTRYCFGAFYNSSMSWLAQESIRHYRPHQGVVVYYDPENPRRSVLEPGVNAFVVVPLVGAILILFALAYSLRGLP